MPKRFRDSAGSTLKTLSRRLIRKGYEVLLATDDAEGVAIATAENPDLILMDLTLPAMNGFEAAALKTAERTRSIPVIAPTAPAMPSLLGKIDALGRNRHEAGGQP